MEGKERTQVAYYSAHNIRTDTSWGDMQETTRPMVEMTRIATIIMDKPTTMTRMPTEGKFVLTFYP